MIRLLKGDILSFARHYKGPRFHAILCDPPYELSFMNKNWDSTGIAFNPETWSALGEHLLPGAFGMAFASSRGWHRLAVAIEDAGYRIHPSIFGWAYGSGFPKATRVDTQVDQAAGVEREVVTIPRDGGPGGKSAHIGQIAADRPSGKTITTLPATELAQTWQHHRYGLQAMKPSLEPIIVFQKPYAGKPVDSIVTTGAGAINIDASRIGLNDETPPTGSGRRDSWREMEGRTDRQVWNGENATPNQGRWPANFVLSHTPDCVQVGTREVKGHRFGKNVRSYSDGKGTTGHPGWQRDAHANYDVKNPDDSCYADENGNETIANWRCVPECPVRRLGEQSGERKSAGRYRDVNGAVSIGARGSGPDTTVCYQKGLGWQRDNDYASDTGTAARFFFQSDWHHEIAERLAQADPVRYQAKASRRERDAGLQGWRIKTRAEITGRKEGSHGLVGADGNNPFSGANYRHGIRNSHPTIKPIELCRWLATLLLPPDAYAPRRILVPFAGTGSEMIGAGLAGWEHIVGIELSMENVLIGEARLNHWLYQPQQGALL